ncbi:hypothetical protein ACF0H5_021236 [Mactra antiquata]
MSLDLVHIYFFMCCSLLVCVSAFASYVPESDGSLEVDDYDVYTKPRSEPMDNKQFYKILSKLLMNYLNRMPARDYMDELNTRPVMGVYGPSKRSMDDEFDGFVGVDKRKIFWQPLGYNPSRSGSGGGGQSSGSGKGKVFRYG